MARAPSPATSGPGISLMSEFIGLAYFAEIPAVIVDVQARRAFHRMPTRTQQSDVLSCAYASHGDTKHVLLFPQDPKEGFEMTAQAFDLADRLQTPGLRALRPRHRHERAPVRSARMERRNHYDRGKVLSYQDLEAGKRFGRYLDLDGDGITWRTYPGTHPKRGSFFTRGTSRDRYARYTEEGSAYVDNMQRLLKKFETAKDLVPKPVLRQGTKPARFGVIYYGSTAAAMDEALSILEDDAVHLDALRIRAFPFQDAVIDFVNSHEHTFVVEQNRDAQLRTLLVAEGMISPEKLTPVLHYDGTPITARFIQGEIAQRLQAFNVTPIKKTVAGD
jgi:2-oxoglutarate ferredoxin oxidoreductase subunit alpha